MSVDLEVSLMMLFLLSLKLITTSSRSKNVLAVDCRFLVLFESESHKLEFF